MKSKQNIDQHRPIVLCKWGMQINWFQLVSNWNQYKQLVIFINGYLIGVGELEKHLNCKYICLLVFNLPQLASLVENSIWKYLLIMAINTNRSKAGRPTNPIGKYSSQPRFQLIYFASSWIQLGPWQMIKQTERYACSV